MAFEPGRPVEPIGLLAGTPVAGTGLPPSVLERLQACQDRAESLHRLLPTSEERGELGIERMKASRRLKQLQDHPHDQGHGLLDNDHRVIAQKQLVDQLTGDLDRLNARYERARALWEPAARIRKVVEDWVRGLPPGTTVEDAPTSEAKANGKAEDLLGGLEKLRRRARELRADLHRVESAPQLSAVAKQRMVEQVEALAVRGRPTVSLLIEHADREILWPQTNIQSMIYGAQTPSFAAAETPDTLALFAWLHRDRLVAALEAEIDGEADDAAALSHEDRERQAAEIQSDLLELEREESALVWRGLSSGMPVEHRADCGPQAILGARLVTLPPGGQTGSSPERAPWDGITGRRR
jgi:hypothetical protein